ncbi:MAG TPA: tRNA (cytidine(34)-2'-O)-methyltransferase [Gemmataceae bacterium]|nr:tRNA (cytidine(34)-2'-O)-methyltransferase [Gemmataceae bacterium]
MLHIALWEPEIPPNTGNIARLCAATGTTLHLIGRLGFRIDDKHLRRAGCDYWPEVCVSLYNSIEEFEVSIPASRVFPFSAHASTPYTRNTFHDGDCLLFGSESKGLPPELMNRYSNPPTCIPMPAGKVRSLNLATAAGIVLYEALRQVHGW